jgi:hypothetical protein
LDAPKTGDGTTGLERALLAAYRRALEGKVYDVAHDLMVALVELQARLPAVVAPGDTAVIDLRVNSPNR